MMTTDTTTVAPRSDLLHQHEGDDHHDNRHGEEPFEKGVSLLTLTVKAAA